MAVSDYAGKGINTNVVLTKIIKTK